MAKKFSLFDISDIENNSHKTYKKIHISTEYSKLEDGTSQTSYEMSFFHKVTRTYYTIRGVARCERGYSWISWNIDSIKRDGKWTADDQAEYDHEKARKEYLRVYDSYPGDETYDY